MIRTLLPDASENLAARYAATNRAILSGYFGRDRASLTQLRPEVIDMAQRLGVYPSGPEKLARKM